MQKLQGETTKFLWRRGWTSSTPSGKPNGLEMIWMRVERASERADTADRALKRAQWQGRSERKLTHRSTRLGPRRLVLSNCMRREKRVGNGPRRRWMSFVPMVNSTIALGLKSKSRGLCRGFRDRSGPRFVGFFRARSRSRSWTGCTTSWVDCHCPKRRVTPWCGYGGCGGNCRGNRPRRRSGVIAMRLPWCSKFSAQVGPELARVVPSDRDRVASDGASQQRSGVHEQRPANASVAASDDDARDVRPETSVLEYSSVSRREAERPLSV